jgi:septal ring factor EnvC (AmiA/AmiB activator)
VRAARVALACAFAGLAPAAAAQEPAGAHAAQEQAARQKLDAVRAQIRALTDQQRATAGERGDAVRELRTRELALAGVARTLVDLDARLAAAQARLDGLDAERARLEQALRQQRTALAALLRSAYALGRHEELRLLLQQDDVAGIARVLAYHRYFQRAQLGRIDRLRADLGRLADVQREIEGARAGLAQARAAQAAQQAELEAERRRRADTLAAIDARLQDAGARLAALGKDEAELNRLLERLRDVFADIPKELKGAQAFASQRGRLPWPLAGKVVGGFGGEHRGLLIAAKAGSPVRAVSHGRVAFADWLRGYGLMIIIDHGDGYLSLYGSNETLLKDVGDWVDAGDTIATSGASGGQASPGLYFELRAKGQPTDPRAWLR